MTACPSLLGDGGGGIATALRSVDCRAGEATGSAFGRLFGEHGALLPALTMLLTIYVALFAVGLLTGRSRIGVTALTPRMITLGLVLTFATSWVAYQNVVWMLAVGAPDQLASLVAGTHGSATTAFADRLDRLFAAVADAAQQSAKPAAATATGITPATPMVGGFTATTVLWLSALVLLLGTVGVLVTTKIVLAALLALGPVFIALALFPATQGLFEGWLKGVTMMALTPLFAVLIGGAAVIALDPVAQAIAMEGSEPSPSAVTVLFLGAAVHLALMAMALRTAGVLVAGWRLPGRGRALPGAAAPAVAATAIDRRPVGGGAVDGALAGSSAMPANNRVRSLVSALSPGEADRGGASDRARRTARVVAIGGGPFVPGPPSGRDRARGVGNPYRIRRPSSFREKRS